MSEKGMPAVEEGTLLWSPDEHFTSSSNMKAFMEWLSEKKNLHFPDYGSLWEWSTLRLEDFWLYLMEYAEVVHSGKASDVLASRKMPPRGWFKGITLNYAENLFRREGKQRPAMIAKGERGGTAEVSWDELRQRVAAMAHYMKSIGIGKGDRVAGYLPNIPESVISFLAAASLGAVWSGCSPDLGSRSVIDRFEQIEPKLLIAVDGYTYGGRDYDRRDTISEVMSSIKSIKRLVLVPYLDRNAKMDSSVSWDDCTSGSHDMLFERVPFEHPLWILYSSGTTGLPKPIVHGHGGILLEHLKMMILHTDLKEGDRFFWYTTTSWMMWNVLVSAMLAGSTSILYDGSAAYPDIGVLWKLAEETRMTVFGTSAAFIGACMKEHIVPREEFDLSSLRSVAYTGSPLPPSGFQWIYENVGAYMWVTSVSGGTDVCTAFLLGCPLLPVRAGELQCRGLGASVESYGEDGKPQIDQVGELVITKPLPSMPVFFWNDRDDERYLDSYFSMFEGVWRHGDWVKIRPTGGAVIYGRSDSTLKRHGVRIGTSEVYGCVEAMPEIQDSLAIGLEKKDGEYFLPLFVVLRAGIKLDEELKKKIRDRIRKELSPRHVPDEIIQITEVPRTLNGKKLEVPVKRILSGQPVEKVVNLGSVSNPASLRFFEEMRNRVA